VAADASAHDRRKKFDAAVRLWNLGFHNSGRERNFIRSFLVALRAIPAIPWKSHITKADWHRSHRRPAIDHKRFTEIDSRVETMNEALQMYAFRRHRTFGPLPLLLIRIRRVVTHHAEFGIFPLLAMSLKFCVTYVAIFNFDGFPSRRWFGIGDGKVFDHVDPASRCPFSSTVPFGLFKSNNR
jgi:hypothetical protein